MHHSDILIIGGGPAAMVTAGTARQYYPNKSVTVLKKGKDSMVPCGIPYVFGPLLESVEDDMIPCGDMAAKMGTELIVEEAVGIDFEKKRVAGKSGESYGYEKLIIATGSVPKIPRQIANHDAPGVFFVPKDPDYIRKMHAEMAGMKKIVVVGTGFIGIEIANEFQDSGKEVTLVGSRLLKHSFDPEVSSYMEKIVENKGIVHYKNQRTCEIVLDERGHACGVKFEDGEVVACDGVVLATGYRPNTDLARKSGLSMRQGDTIYVDEYMRTTQPDVFAIGDCAEKRHFITKRTIPVMLASTATAEARIAVANLYSINLVKSFSGTIAIFSTVIGDTCFGSAGITEEDARKQRIDITTTVVTVPDKHPAKLPNSHEQAVKLIASRATGQLIGAQVVGGIDIGEMINMLGTIIENRMTVFDLLGLQVATHPLLTSAPTTYPIIVAAQNIAARTLGA
ncbi:NAD(P)/FAD-dependent oxidoreductase [Hydrogenimonas urashimensis]|uniref:NAD(P)/FAD-dependent oxidoreductase n=1 Tax=Hydrogenimonas urashimensis TaxID=2740515 RepID=UPI0019151140|nr:FAD-dependent oxidoreductase [Hydrogenimonas urashimensis]